MLDGLWTAITSANITNIDKRPSVIVFREGKIFGGNSTVYFVGDYSIKGDHLFGGLTTTHYAGDPITLFGLVSVGESSQLRFEGKIESNKIAANGYLVDNPKLQFHIEMTKRVEL